MNEQSRCRSCQAVIYWAETRNGKRTPMNPDQTPHWATCPQARGWKQKEKAE